MTYQGFNFPMDFGIFLSKLLPLFVYPLGLGLLLSIFALLMLLVKWRKLAFVSLALGILIVASSSTEMMVNRLLSPLENQFPPIAIEDAPLADAIVVLGGGVDPKRPPQLAAQLNRDGHRVLHAARLYRAARAPIIILSGGNVFGPESDDNQSVATREIMSELGVNTGSIVMEQTSRNTYENALEVRKVLKAKGLRRVLLVTSAYHMPRAMAAFQSQEIDAIAQPANFLLVEEGKPAILSWVPHAFRLEQTHLALKEYLGFFVYRWRGWISEDYGFTPGG